MTTTKIKFGGLAAGLFFLVCSCGKSGNSGNGATGPGAALFPLAAGDLWNYKLKIYDTATAAVTDSSYFTLGVSGTVSANGETYYRFQNSPDTTVLSTLAPVNATSLGSIDYQYGMDFYTFFAAGSGDSTQAVGSWPVKIAGNGSTCQGTDKLFAHYADTTLQNLDGTTYSASMKNVIETYDCSGHKYLANVYFIKAGTGLVRFSRYIYNAAGVPKLEVAWVLESTTLH